MRVLLVEDEPYMAEAIRDGLRLEAIAADIAGDGDIALELLSVNAYDIAVLDRDIPGPSGDEIAKRIVAVGSGMPILMLTAADRLDDKASGFELGADDYLTKPFELQELVLRLRALDRRRAHNRPPVREIAGLRLDPFRREVYRDGRYVALTRKQFAVLEVLVAAEGGVVSAEELLERAWDENADPFTNAVRITVRHCANASENPGSSPPWPASATASTLNQTPGVREETVDRAPGMSVRLKLTLSYAGFLMLAGALLLAVVLVFLLRYVPEGPMGPPGRLVLTGPDRSDLWHAFAPKAAAALAFLLVFGLVGGWLLAGRMLAPLARITDATRMAADGSLSHRIWLSGRRDEFRELADAFDAMLARLEAQIAEQQRFAANAFSRTAHPTGDLADTSGGDPQRSEPRQRQTRRTPPRRQRPSDPPHRSIAPAQPLRPAILHPRTRGLVPHSGRSHRNAPPPRREARRHHPDLRGRHSHHRLTRSVAADDDEPPAQRHRPQPPRTWNRAGQHRHPPQSVMLTVENTGEKLTPQLVSTLTEPFQRGTERIRTDHAGVGLGLAIVKSITQAHDGTLTIVARPDGGICVTAQLPVWVSNPNGVSGAVG
jgi:two-component system response regulator VanR